MANTYVNKIQLADGTSLIDISDTTATADKILSGYTAYGADGSKLTGTATGGSGDGYVWQDAQGYVHLSDEEGTQPIYDTLNVNASGTFTPSQGHAYNSVVVPSGTATPASSISATGATVSTSTNTLTLSKSSVSNTPQVSSGYVSSGTAGNSSVSLSATVSINPTPTASGATVTIPAGYYSSQTTKSVTSGTAGTPTATKGTVSNHSVSVTPSVTNTTGYITGGTKTGTTVSVSASELVSGTYSVTSSGTKDVTNYASASVPAGMEGTPTATKGTVSNHSVTVTPSVTNSGGYISGSTKTGTAVTVSASELVSGTKSITANGTGIDVADYASVNVSVSGGGGSGLVYETGTFTPNSDANNITISFANTHTTKPLFCFIYDSSEGSIPNSSFAAVTITNLYAYAGHTLVNDYLSIARVRASSSGASNTNMNVSNDSSSFDTQLTNTSFQPSYATTGYSWRSSRTYKWIAVWAPTT